MLQSFKKTYKTGLIIHGKWNVYIKEKELHKILLFEMYGKQSQSI